MDSKKWVVFYFNTFFYTTNRNYEYLGGYVSFSRLVRDFRSPHRRIVKLSLEN